MFQPGGGGLRLIRNYQRPLFPYRRRTDSRQPPPSPTRRKDLHQEAAHHSPWNQRLGGVWPFAKKRALARVSPPILYRRGEKTETGKSPGLDANNPETNLPPFNPLLGRSLASAQLRLSRRFRSRTTEPPSLSFCGRFSGWWMDIAEPGLAFNEADGGGGLQKEGTSTFSSSGLEKLVLSRY